MPGSNVSNSSGSGSASGSGGELCMVVMILSHCHTWCIGIAVERVCVWVLSRHVLTGYMLRRDVELEVLLRVCQK